jgi:hypothetical protein
MNHYALPRERTMQAAVRQLLIAVDDCQELLKCARMQEGSTCMHRIRRFAEERLCPACRLIGAVDELERTTF